MDNCYPQATTMTALCSKSTATAQLKTKWCWSTRSERSTWFVWRLLINSDPPVWNEPSMRARWCRLTALHTSSSGSLTSMTTGHHSLPIEPQQVIGVFFFSLRSPPPTPDSPSPPPFPTPSRDGVYWKHYVRPSVQFCPDTMSQAHPTAFSQTWYGGVLSWDGASCRKFVCYLQGQGHSKGLSNQNMTVSIRFSKGLVRLQPNLVW